MKEETTNLDDSGQWILETLSTLAPNITHLTSATNPTEVAIAIGFIAGALEAQDYRFKVIFEGTREFIRASYEEYLDKFFETEGQKRDRNTIYYVIPSALVTPTPKGREIV